MEIEPRQIQRESACTDSTGRLGKKIRRNMTYKYTFKGIVHPKRVKFSVNAKFGLQIKRPEFGIDGVFGIEFKDSDFVAEYTTVVDHTKSENANFETLRNYIEEAIRLIVDIYCYIKSYSYDVEIIKVECAELKINYIFDVQGEKNIIKDQKQTDEGFTSLMMFFAMRSDLDFLRHALTDFRRSIKYPAETAAFCFRAIETIRRFYFEDMEIKDENKRREKGWRELRTTLNFDREFFEDIEKFALPNRHGEYPIITYEKREVIMNKTRQVMDAFIKHVNEKRIDEVRLPDGRKEGKVSKIW